MEASCSSKITITLWLSQEEAEWLLALVQNPPCDPKDEPPYDAKMREDLFNVLRAATPCH